MADEKSDGPDAPADGKASEKAAAGKPPAAPKAAKPAAPKGRVCEPSDRAADGLRRFKLRLDGHPSGARSQRYVLAPDRTAAVGVYLQAEGIDPAEVDGKAVKVVVVELPD